MTDILTQTFAAHRPTGGLVRIIAVADRPLTLPAVSPPDAAPYARATSAERPVALFEREFLPLLDAAYSFARYLSRDPDAAHDIVQEAYLRAYRGRDGFRGGDPRTWLFSIVRNCCRDWQLARGRRARHEVEDRAFGADEDDVLPQVASEEDTPEVAMIRKDEVDQVRTVLADLPRPLREILVLRELEDLSYRDIAEVTEVPIGTVMSRLARACVAFGTAWRKVASEAGR